MATRKGRVYAVWLQDLSLRASQLLQREMLAVGGETAPARGNAGRSAPGSVIVLLATWEQYQRLVPKLRRQPFGLEAAADEIEAVLRHHLRRGARTIPGAHREWVLGDRPRVMGVLNVTPDSFSDGGRYADPERAIARAEEIAIEGADVIDIGGESTRPGAAPVDAAEEWRRIGPVLENLSGRLHIPISVDTRHSAVARRAIDAGADIVNDIEGLSDPAMRAVVLETGAAAVVMHMRGSPATMQKETHYRDVRGEVYRALADATDCAVAQGIAPGRLLVDPGLGFGKSSEASLELLSHAGEFRSLGYPVVIGASRKSFLGWALGPEAPAAAREEAGLAAAVMAALEGVELLRTHEVGATVRALALVHRVCEAAMDEVGPA